jgi:hypothetical protein
MAQKSLCCISPSICRKRCVIVPSSGGSHYTLRNTREHLFLEERKDLGCCAQFEEYLKEEGARGETCRVHTQHEEEDLHKLMNS